MPIVIISIAAILLLVALGVFLRFAWSRNRLRGAARQRAIRSIANVRSIPDLHRRILEADSVLERALGDLRYRGSMADKLRSAGKYLPAVQDIWTAHKLRNRIAHEPGIVITPQEAERSVAAFERAVLRLCSQR